MLHFLFCCYGFFCLFCGFFWVVWEILSCLLFPCRGSSLSQYVESFLKSVKMPSAFETAGKELRRKINSYLEFLINYRMSVWLRSLVVLREMICYQLDFFPFLKSYSVSTVIDSLLYNIRLYSRKYNTAAVSAEFRTLIKMIYTVFENNETYLASTIE